MADVKVLIVDDQAPFRSAARAVLSLTTGFEAVGEAESGEDAVDATESLHPDMVLMDINMPGIDGIEAARRIAATHPDIVIVLVSTYGVADVALDSLSPGACAYVHKEELTPRLLQDLWEEHHLQPS